MKKNYYNFSILFLVFLLTTSCSKDDSVEDDADDSNTSVTITTTNFNKTIDENPDDGSVLGKVSASVNTDDDISYAIISQSVTGALGINNITGELTVNVVSAFDYETNEQLTAEVEVTAGNESDVIDVTIILNNLETLKEITYNWDNAVDNGDNVTSLIDDVTVTVEMSQVYINTIAGGGYAGSSGRVVWNRDYTGPTTATFTFSEPVTVKSILPLEGRGRTSNNYTYTFSTNDGDNSNVMVDVQYIDRDTSFSTATLNWTGVTSFTVTEPNGSNMGYDNLVIERVRD